MKGISCCKLPAEQNPLSETDPAGSISRSVSPLWYLSTCCFQRSFSSTLTFCFISTLHVCYYPVCTQIMSGSSGGSAIYSLYIHFFFSLLVLNGPEITTAVKKIWFIGQCDRNWQVSFHLPSRSPTRRLSRSAPLGAISVLIKSKCFFFQFHKILNFSASFFLMSNSPDCAAPSS